MCAFDLRGVRLEEKTRADAGVAELGEQVAEPICRAGRQVPSSVRGENTGRVGDERHLGRTDAQHEVDKFRARVAFDVELDREHRGEIEDVLEGDVTRVGTRMDRDAVASGGDAGARRCDHVGDIAAARIAERRDFVEVDAETNHFPKLPERHIAFTRTADGVRFLVMILLNAAESRELDRLSQDKYGIPSYSLMTRAGEAVADALVENFPDATTDVLVVAGKGNNGGDGFVAGRRLIQDGFAVRAVLLGRAADLKGDAARAHAEFRAAEARRSRRRRRPVSMRR